MTQPADVLQEASNFIGYRETPDGSNVVPGITDWWPMVGAWCACYVSRVFWNVGMALGPYDNGHSGGYLWCSDGADWFRAGRGNAAGIVSADRSQPGDVLFAEWGSTPGGYDHTGIVVENTGSGLITVEGNVGNRVDVFTRAYWEIPEVGRPRWAVPTGEDDDVVLKQIGWTKPGSAWARRVLDSNMKPDASAALMIYEGGIVTHIEDTRTVEQMKRLGVPDIGQVDDVVLMSYAFAAERIS